MKMKIYEEFLGNDDIKKERDFWGDENLATGCFRLLLFPIRQYIAAVNDEL